jgi:hypothetical protein
MTYTSTSVSAEVPALRVIKSTGVVVQMFNDRLATREPERTCCRELLRPLALTRAPECGKRRLKSRFRCLHITNKSERDLHRAAARGFVKKVEKSRSRPTSFRELFFVSHPAHDVFLRLGLEGYVVAKCQPRAPLLRRADARPLLHSPPTAETFYGGDFDVSAS